MNQQFSGYSSAFEGHVETMSEPLMRLSLNHALQVKPILRVSGFITSWFENRYMDSEELYTISNYNLIIMKKISVMKSHNFHFDMKTG